MAHDLAHNELKPKKHPDVKSNSLISFKVQKGAFVCLPEYVGVWSVFFPVAKHSRRLNKSKQSTKHNPTLTHVVAMYQKHRLGVVVVVVWWGGGQRESLHNDQGPPFGDGCSTLPLPAGAPQLIQRVSTDKIHLQLQQGMPR
jgi:hypothetical protein